MKKGMKYEIYLITHKTLRDILQRSGGHHVKKKFVFRPLSIAQKFLAE